MADYIAGDVVARLRADVTQFNQALQDVIQRLAQLNQATAQARTQQTQGQQATAQQAQATTQLARTAQTATQALGQLRQQTQQVQQAQQQATTTTRAFGSSLQTAFAVAGGIGIATSIGAIVGQMKELAVQTVQTGTRLESLRASLSALGGGPGVGAQQFQMLVDMAQRLGVALEPLARGWRTLTAAATQAKLPMEDQVRLLDAMSKEARRTGASSDDLGRAILAVGQMASKGKVSMEELRQQLGEALVTSLTAAAMGMGRTTDELIKLVEAGNVSFVPFAQALTRGFEQMQRASGTFSEGGREAFNRLATAWTVLQDTIMKGGLNTYLNTVITNLQNVVEWTTKAVAPDPRRVGLRPLTEMGATPDQAKQVAGLERTRDAYLRQAANAQNEANRTQYTAMAARTQEVLEQVMATVRATREQQAAQKQVTDETNKTLDVQARQKVFSESFAKAQAQIAKDVAAYREQAALAPEKFGRPAGTADEITAYNQGLQEIIGKQVEGLAVLAQNRSKDIQLTSEQAKALAALDAQYGQLGRTSDAAREKERAAKQAAREAESEAKKAAREAEQADKEFADQRMQRLREIATEEERNLDILRQLAAQYGQTKQLRDIDTANQAMASLAGTHAANRQEAEQYYNVIRDVAQIEARIADLRREAAASAPAGLAAMAQARATATFEEDLASRLTQLRTPREEREGLRLRRRAEREEIDLTPQLEQQLRLIDEQIRWNTLMDHAGQIADQAAQTITSGLMRMVDGTVAVGEGFKAMAKSILDSMAEIALNETFRLLFRLGLGVLGGAAGGGFSNAGASAGGGAGGFEILMAQHGAVVNKPTLIMAGEASQNNPEYVLNRQQMASVMRGGPSAGGQAVTVINVASREQADIEAARERAMGRQVVVNYVLEELGQGSGSRISQVMRSTLR